MYKFIVLITTALFLQSCVSAMSDFQRVNANYQKDMPIKVDGNKLTGGVYVLGRKDAHQVRADFFKKASLFKVTSCHREWTWSEPGSYVEFEYRAVDGIENRALCPVELGAFDLKGQHSWAYIDFIDDETLVAELYCNGVQKKFLGVSICQSRRELIQEIRFAVEVERFGVDRCATAETVDKKTYRIVLGEGRCVYLFKSKAGNIHRLTTLGYAETLLRD